MKFDYTKGNVAKYIVSVYNWNLNDHYYFHYYNDAKKMFNELSSKKFDEGTSISISDIVKDIRKDFYKF